MNVHNIMEEVVDQAVNQLFDQIKESKPSWFSCDCENCRLDTVSYVLNRIPPKYIVSGRGATHSAETLSDLQLKADLDQLALEGMRKVNSTKRPYHDAAKNQVRNADNMKPAFNFAIFTGTVMDGSNFEPLSGATITLKIDGQLAEMADKSWSNPYTTCTATKGNYSFMVKSIPAEKEGITKNFGFTMEVTAPKYSTATFHFEVPVTSASYIKNEIDSTYSIKINDLTIFKEFVDNPME